MCIAKTVLAGKCFYLRLLESNCFFYLQSILPHIDSVLYVDNDVLFLSPPEEVWDFFKVMNSSQMAAMSPEHEDYAAGWYNRFAKHPFVKPLGVNSGVMLMNLTRMRKFDWESYLQPVLEQYKLEIVWGDQDIINIIFHFNTGKSRRTRGSTWARDYNFYFRFPQINCTFSLATGTIVRTIAFTLKSVKRSLERVLRFSMGIATLSLTTSCQHLKPSSVPCNPILLAPRFAAISLSQ